MKIKIVVSVGLLLVLANSAVYSGTGNTASWMLQAGLILLFGALAVFAGGKRRVSENRSVWRVAEIGSYGLMLFFIMWGFLTGQWYLHPLGMLISIAGGVWAVYRGLRDAGNSTTLTVSRFIRESYPPVLRIILVVVFAISVILTTLDLDYQKRNVATRIEARQNQLLNEVRSIFKPGADNDWYQIRYDNLSKYDTTLIKLNDIKNTSLPVLVIEHSTLTYLLLTLAALIPVFRLGFVLAISAFRDAPSLAVAIRKAVNAMTVFQKTQLTILAIIAIAVVSIFVVYLYQIL